MERELNLDAEGMARIRESEWPFPQNRNPKKGPKSIKQKLLVPPLVAVYQRGSADCTTDCIRRNDKVLSFTRYSGLLLWRNPDWEPRTAERIFRI
eukprot:3780535-Rhodomonas_salina.1